MSLVTAQGLKMHCEPLLDLLASDPQNAIQVYIFV